MKIILLCTDSALHEHWMNALRSFNPVVHNAFNSSMDYNSVVFAHDEIIKKLSEEEIKNLFLRRVMIFSRIPNFSEAQHLLHRGAMGYTNAMMHKSHLLSAYQALNEGKIWLHPDFITMMIAQIQEQQSVKEKSLVVLDVLSQREREVALMLGDGATHQEIADALNITVRTVKAHATAIYQKLSVKDRLALSLLLHS
jgi:DNA-binding NarL/FixJ family response regulator